MTVVLPRTDHEIHQAVLDEILWDPRVEQTEIGVEVDKGVVTLTGTVSSYGKKLAAQQAAHRVTGVLDVANDVQVRYPGAPQHTDTEIATAVREALKWDVFVPHQDIQTTVINGWVTLHGVVPTWADRLDAERAIDRLEGVRGILDNLTVAEPKVDPATIRTNLEAALERRADREADRIAVDVTAGTVILTGRVHNWTEKQSILGAAEHTMGVKKIEDHLRIDPFF
ncbi:MAG TPA: BON domain-containing protein [Armatimonadota bacterium]|nr:BON domain-containing protein [Armatimonadota bacterium]